MEPGGLLLGIDTCGSTGSVALGELAGRDLEILGQKELEGPSYSATLVPLSPNCSIAIKSR